MKSLSGFLRTQRLNRRLEQPPLVIDSPVLSTGISVSFSVHTWIEYHNRAKGSFTGEPDMVEWLKTALRPGDVLWDIGANVGAYAILAAKLCPEARVIAFEPFIPNFGHLWENIVLNGVTAQITPICAGLTDRTALSALAVSDPRAGSSQHQVGRTDGKLQQGVLAARGDDLCALLGVPAPTLLKLDIDGLELPALTGLRESLRSVTLRAAMIEIPADGAADAVLKYCEEVGLRRLPNPRAVAADGVVNALFGK